MLYADKVYRKISERPILENISIKVPIGRITLLLGPSGSGKTSILKCLSFLDLPDEGEIGIGNKKYTFGDKKSKEIDAHWPQVTVVFQQLFLWPHLSLRENIELPLENRNYNTTEVDWLIDSFGIRNCIDQLPTETSLGQRQRASIVRALALKPDYLLLDEITSSLDYEQANIILNHLFELKNTNIGILLITHHLDFVKKVLEDDSLAKFYFIDNGRVLEVGNKNEFYNPQTDRFKRYLNI